MQHRPPIELGGSSRLFFYPRLEPTVQLLHRIPAPPGLSATCTPALAWRDTRPAPPTATSAVTALALVTPANFAEKIAEGAAAPEAATPTATSAGHACGVGGATLAIAWGRRLQLLRPSLGDKIAEFAENSSRHGIVGDTFEGER